MLLKLTLLSLCRWCVVASRLDTLVPSLTKAAQLYNYIPSMVLSVRSYSCSLLKTSAEPSDAQVIALISFAVTFFLHGWHAFRTRHRSFHVLLAVGSAIEVVGWASRAVSHEKLFAIDLYVVQVRAPHLLTSRHSG